MSFSRYPTPLKDNTYVRIVQYVLRIGSEYGGNTNRPPHSPTQKTLNRVLSTNRKSYVSLENLYMSESVTTSESQGVVK